MKNMKLPPFKCVSFPLNPESASHNYCRLLCRLLVILKVIFANSVDPDQTDQGAHCLPVCKNRFEKSARIFSRRHKQTTFSDVVFLGALRVNIVSYSLKANNHCLSKQAF